MGIKNCPETPRQRMINMMYIVLTAMLALNVAAEVLEAFRVVDASLIQTLYAVDSKNAQIYSAFEQAYVENPAKVQEWKIKAENVKTKTDSLINYIWHLKEKLVVASGAKQPKRKRPLTGEEFIFVTIAGDTLVIKKEDDINTPSEIMIAQKKGIELKAKIAEYKEYMISQLGENDPELKEVIRQELETAETKAKGEERKSWEIAHFDSKPLAGILTFMSKLQIDIKNSEANIINHFYSNIDATSYKFNKLGAEVVANSAMVLQGDEYTAEIFLAAIDTTVDPEIYVHNTLLPIRDGKATYKVRANEAGTFKWSGILKYKTPEGILKNYTFEKEYQVTLPSVTISPTKMNVFFRGIANPIDVSVPGMVKENLRVEMTNGKVVPSGNIWIVQPADLDEMGRKTKVTVYASVAGSERLMGTMDFRVKKVPDPVAQVGTQSGGNIRKEDLLAEEGVAAVLKDFDFELRFTVTQFDVSLPQSGGYTNTWKSANNRFTADQKSQFRNLVNGSIVYIDNIKAHGDDGTDRPLDPISFKIR